jgi:Ca2+/H+ antiporter
MITLKTKKEKMDTIFGSILGHIWLILGVLLVVGGLSYAVMTESASDSLFLGIFSFIAGVPFLSWYFL